MSGRVRAQRARQIRVVADDDVALVVVVEVGERLGHVEPEIRRGAQVQGYATYSPRRDETRREVRGLLDERRVGGALHDARHVLHDGLVVIAEDLERDPVDGHARTPLAGERSGPPETARTVRYTWPGAPAGASRARSPHRGTRRFRSDSATAPPRPGPPPTARSPRVVSSPAVRARRATRVTSSSIHTVGSQEWFIRSLASPGPVKYRPSPTATLPFRQTRTTSQPHITTGSPAAIGARANNPQPSIADVRTSSRGSIHEVVRYVTAAPLDDEVPERASTMARKPAGTSVVVSSCSTTAGPSRCWPAGGRPAGTRRRRGAVLR